MRSQKDAADRRLLYLIGYMDQRGVAFQVGKREKDGRESNDPTHGPCTPLTDQANEPPSRSQRGVIQPDGNDEQFGRKKDRQNKEPREQANGTTRSRKCLGAMGHEKPCRLLTERLFHK